MPWRKPLCCHITEDYTAAGTEQAIADLVHQMEVGTLWVPEWSLST